MFLNQSFLKGLNVLGFWQWDFVADRVKACPVLNQFLGIVPAVDDHGLESSLYWRKIHPDDRAWLRDEQGRGLCQQGQNMMEFRLLDTQGATHWVMCHDSCERGPDGEVVSVRGMLIDITAVKAQGEVCRTPPVLQSRPLVRLVDATIEAHVAARQLGDVVMMTQLEAVLIGAAKRLAADLPAAQDYLLLDGF